MEIITKNVQQTKKVGKILAEEIIKGRLSGKGSLVIGLEGNLGSGKTTFIQGFAGGLKIKEKLTSPTFVIFKKYKIPQTNKWLYHIDCYRINSKDLKELGIDDILIAKDNIVVIEWAERVKSLLPAETMIWIKIVYRGQNRRLLRLDLRSKAKKQNNFSL